MTETPVPTPGAIVGAFVGQEPLLSTPFPQLQFGWSETRRKPERSFLAITPVKSVYTGQSVGRAAANPPKAIFFFVRQ